MESEGINDALWQVYRDAVVRGPCDSGGGEGYKKAKVYIKMHPCISIRGSVCQSVGLSVILLLFQWKSTFSNQSKLEEANESMS